VRNGSTPAPPAAEAPAGSGLGIGFGLAFGAGTLVVAASTVQSGVLHAMSPGGHVGFGRLVLWPAISWYAWALLAPFVFALVRRVPPAPGRWGRRLAVLTGGMAVFYAVHVAIQVLAMGLPAFADLHPDLAHAVSSHASTSIYPNAVTYW